MGYILVAQNRENTISCGLRVNFHNLNVHNLFIGYFANAGLFAFSDHRKDKRGGEFRHSPPFPKTFERNLSY